MPLYRYQSALVLFIHIPKTGGTSVERCFREAGCAQALHIGRRTNFTKVTPQHYHYRILADFVRPPFYDYAFAVVRNPFDRLASEYKMRAHEGIAPVDEWVQNVFRRFAEYPATLDNHIRPQSDFLGSGVDVFHFEDGLDAAVRKAFDLMALPQPPMPHRRRSSPGTLPASKATLAEIAAFYHADFETLGYAKDDYRRSFHVTD